MRALLLLSFALLLSACTEQELYTRLSERQANEMVAVLRNAQIEAQKKLKEGQLYALSVPSENFSQAIEILRISGLPHESFETLGEVFKKEGFVSSPLEERARLIHALSQEISRTVSSIDGVVIARVHLSVPERDPLVEKQPPASASVFIKHRAGVDLSAQVGQIKAMVVNSIHELPYDKVTVVLFPAEPLPVQRSAAAIAPFPLGLMWAGGLAMLVIAIGTGIRWTMGRRRKAGSSLNPPSGGTFKKKPVA